MKIKKFCKLNDGLPENFGTGVFALQYIYLPGNNMINSLYGKIVLGLHLSFMFR